MSYPPSFCRDLRNCRWAACGCDKKQPNAAGGTDPYSPANTVGHPDKPAAPYEKLPVCNVCHHTSPFKDERCRESTCPLLSSEKKEIDPDAAVAMLADYPNLQAVLIGTVSGHYTEWPMLRVELRRLLAAQSAIER